MDGTDKDKAITRYERLVKEEAKLFRIVEANANKANALLLDTLGSRLLSIVKKTDLFASLTLSREDVDAIGKKHLVVGVDQLVEEEPDVEEVLESLHEEQRRSEALRAENEKVCKENERLERLLALSNTTLEAEKKKSSALATQLQEKQHTYGTIVNKDPGKSRGVCRQNTSLSNSQNINSRGVSGDIVPPEGVLVRDGGNADTQSLLDYAHIIQQHPLMGCEEGRTLVTAVNDNIQYLKSLKLSNEGKELLKIALCQVVNRINQGEKYIRAEVSILAFTVESVLASTGNLPDLFDIFTKFFSTFEGAELYHSSVVQTASKALADAKKEMIGTQSTTNAVYTSIDSNVSQESSGGNSERSQAETIKESIEALFDGKTEAQKEADAKKKLKVKTPARNLIKIGIAVRIVVGVMITLRFCFLSAELQLSIARLSRDMGIDQNLETLSDAWSIVIYPALHSMSSTHVSTAEEIVIELILFLGKFKKSSEVADAFNAEAGRPLLGNGPTVTGSYYEDDDEKSKHQVRVTFLILAGERLKVKTREHCGLPIDLPRILLRNSYTNLAARYGSLVWKSTTGSTAWQTILDDSVDESFLKVIYTERSYALLRLASK